MKGRIVRFRQLPLSIVCVKVISDVSLAQCRTELSPWGMNYFSHVCRHCPLQFPELYSSSWLLFLSAFSSGRCVCVFMSVPRDRCVCFKILTLAHFLKRHSTIKPDKKGKVSHEAKTSNAHARPRAFNIRKFS